VWGSVGVCPLGGKNCRWGKGVCGNWEGVSYVCCVVWGHGGLGWAGEKWHGSNTAVLEKGVVGVSWGKVCNVLCGLSWGGVGCPTVVVVGSLGRGGVCVGWWGQCGVGSVWGCGPVWGQCRCPWNAPNGKQVQVKGVGSPGRLSQSTS